MMARLARGDAAGAVPRGHLRHRGGRRVRRDRPRPHDGRAQPRAARSSVRRSGCTARPSSSTRRSAASTSTTTGSSSTSAGRPSSCAPWSASWPTATSTTSRRSPAPTPRPRCWPGTSRTGWPPASRPGRSAPAARSRGIVGHPARVPRRLGELRAGAVRAGDASCTSWCPRGSTTRCARAAATPTTGGCAGSWRRGWSVPRASSRRGLAVDGAPERATLERALRALPDGGVVLVDGLVASALPRRSLVPASAGCGWSCSCTCRSAIATSRRGLHPSSAVLCGARGRGRHDRATWSRPGCSSTTAWTRTRPRRPARGRRRRLAARSDGGRRRLLCVGGAHAGKGHDVLVAALAALAGPAVAVHCVGSLTAAPGSPTGCGAPVASRARRPGSC